MDKIVSTMGRQLQAMTTEEVNIGTFELYQKFRFDKPLNMYEKTENESRIEAAYETASEQLLANQNCFKTFFIHGKNKVTVELIDSDTIEENSEHDNEALPKWNHYVQHFMKSLCEDASSLSADEQQHFAEILAEKPVFLMRNVRVVMEHNKGYEEESKQQENSRREDSVSGEKEQPLIVREDLHVHFTSSNNYRMQFVAGSSDVLIRYGAAQRGMKKHKLVVARRKERFTSWLELHRYDEGSDLLGTPRNWLSDGSKIIPVRHPKLPYLIYNRYVSTASDDCRSSSISTTHS
ncbi:hypothetical protein AB6A40_008934 [Gnathostoma spinigerum]|uniref:Sin3 C-terminal domain-containing protein n=1 Tax=Gnathostoma spinigerum TaxID=75299 RepID=A0ABD6ERQ0_9BILA